MIYSSRRARRTRAMAEALAMIANAHAPLAPHRPHPDPDGEESLFESATEFCAALENYAKRATQMKRLNH
ncbi:MAG: hypothetical protein L0Y50_11900 [Beijerinckiaceae bacterium]|nr:hypothetical protein [Beijerinckiaceae bacterium]MCI0736950.1 hypothetical protein [Beijerinckiaceae bacterium]